MADPAGLQLQASIYWAKSHQSALFNSIPAIHAPRLLSSMSRGFEQFVVPTVVFRQRKFSPYKVY
jgi:hypothetical protein